MAGMPQIRTGARAAVAADSTDSYEAPEPPEMAQVTQIRPRPGPPLGHECARPPTDQRTGTRHWALRTGHWAPAPDTLPPFKATRPRRDRNPARCPRWSR